MLQCGQQKHVVNGETREIFKDPITDNGVKKSAKGFVKVVWENGNYRLVDQCPSMTEFDDRMREVFRNGDLLIDDTLAIIRGRVSAN